MRKEGVLAAIAVLLLAGIISPLRTATAQTQPSGSVPCSISRLLSPTQGHYTGAWQSTGDYTFDAKFPAQNGSPAYEKIIDLKLIIDGKLDVTVSASGAMNGTASGNVQAPIFHDGQRDISSGVGTISGVISGQYAGVGTRLTLPHPTLDIHWGTFGGNAVETFPALSDFIFTVNNLDCISSQGTSLEQGFPAMNITSDGTGQLTQAVGVGSSTGTWSLISDQTSEFNARSQQINSFISSANALFSSSTPLTGVALTQQVLRPLRALETAIAADPAIARCLLEQLGSWEAQALPAIYKRVQTQAGSAATVSDLRQAGDLLNAATQLNSDCNMADGGAGASLAAAQRSMLDGAIKQRDWVTAALAAREMLLIGGQSVRVALGTELTVDLHALVQTASPASMLDVARMSYALGDDADASAAVQRVALPATRSGDSVPWKPVKKSKAKPKKTKAKKKKKTPKPTVTPKPTATPVPQPKTLAQQLSTGISDITVLKPSGSPPTFLWTPVNGAATYIVTVTSNSQPALVWSWAGTSTLAVYGDTAVPGLDGSAGEAWTVPLPASYTWSVIALDAQGRIIAEHVRAS
ncbi:MAG TPA: hypothetical protein VF898_13620 [Chloroflexota bacterium]